MPECQQDVLLAYQWLFQEIFITLAEQASEHGRESTFQRYLNSKIANIDELDVDELLEAQLKAFHKLQPHQGCVDRGDFFIKEQMPKKQGLANYDSSGKTKRMLDFTLNMNSKELSFGLKMKKSQEEEAAAGLNQDLDDLVPRIQVPSPMK